MSAKFSKLFQKWSCFGGRATSVEDEAMSNLRRNQPKIVITECKSAATSPSLSRGSSSSGSSDNIVQSDDDFETEIFLTTDGQQHKMGMEILVRIRSVDEIDGEGGHQEIVSLTRVTKIELGSFAHGFGIREGDILSKVNGKMCSKSFIDIKEAFTCRNSSELEMEIIRKIVDQNTGKVELREMTIRGRGTEGSTEEVLEVIKISGSAWSLNDVGKYFKVGQRHSLLQFDSDNTPWLVQDNYQLILSTNLSQEEVMSNAMFCIHDYWIQGSGDRVHVALQHVTSGLCVSVTANGIKMVEENELDEVSNHSIIFVMKAPRGAGAQVTFRSALNGSYLGFNYNGRTPYGPAALFSEEERNIMFIKSDI